MLEAITGTIVALHEGSVVVQTGPFEMRFRCGATLLEMLRLGEESRLLTLVEPGPQGQGLVGFAFGSEAERDLFGILRDIQGVGPSTAMAILSFPAPAIQNGVENEDATLFKTAKGVGPKLANRILGELRSSEKLEMLGLTASASSTKSREAIDALKGLGFSSSDAIQMVASLPDTLSLEELIRRALRGGEE